MQESWLAEFVEAILVCLFSFGVPAVILSLLYGHFPAGGCDPGDLLVLPAPCHQILKG